MTAKRRKLAEARAAVLAARLAPGANFGGLAATYSEHQETRYTGGDLGCQAKGMVSFSPDSAVSAALFAPNAPGQLSGDVKANGGSYFSSCSNALRLERWATRAPRAASARTCGPRAREADDAMLKTLASTPATVHLEKLAALFAPGAANAGEAPPNRPPAGPRGLPAV